MLRRLLAVTAATVLGVGVLAGPAHAAPGILSEVKVVKLTTTHMTLRFACTGTVAGWDATIYQNDEKGYAYASKSPNPSCTGVQKDYVMPLFSYGNPVVPDQLEAGQAADVHTDVWLTDGGTSGGWSYPVPIVKGSVPAVRVMDFAPTNPVSIWAGAGKPYADVWFRCDAGLRVLATTAIDGWRMPDTAVTCTGAYQKARGALVRTTAGAVAPKKGQRVGVYEFSVRSAHVQAYDGEGRAVTVF